MSKSATADVDEWLQELDDYYRNNTFATKTLNIARELFHLCCDTLTYADEGIERKKPVHQSYGVCRLCIVRYTDVWARFNGRERPSEFQRNTS